MSNAMNRQTNNKNILDIILRSILNNEDIYLKAKEISVTSVLEKLNGKDVDETRKLILFTFEISDFFAKSR